MALLLLCLIIFLRNEAMTRQRNPLEAQKVNFFAGEESKYLLTDRYVLGHVTGLNGFYLSRFKTPFLNLPVL